MPFELKRAPFHPIYGYNSPHLPYGTDPVEEVVEVPVEAVEESGDAHTFSETVEVEHEAETLQNDYRADDIEDHVEG